MPSKPIRINARDQQRHERWLTEITSLPTAAFAEQAVADWLSRWLADRPDLSVQQDRFGNVLVSHQAASKSRSPLVITAHLDHPAFVITDVSNAGDGWIEAEFRGGVQQSYFAGSRVRAWPCDDMNGEVSRGRIERYRPAGKDSADPKVTVRFSKRTAKRLAPGDLLTWAFGGKMSGVENGSQIRGGHLYAPACDDLSAVAAAVCVLDRWMKLSIGKPPQDLRVLFTRAEEVGFIGALAAIESRLLPKASRLICLENSKSFVESPIGGGPIVRVGDRASTFHPQLTRRLTQVAQTLEADNLEFKYQRRLMPGGTCEATAFQAAGYIATCVCLPLGNYHNMGPVRSGRGQVQPEVISIDDFHRLIQLLLEIVRVDPLGSDDVMPDALAARLSSLIDQRRDELVDAPLVMGR